MDKGGCVLLSKDKKQVCLVHRVKLKDYSFPKGHIEKGETILEGSLRETEEETMHTPILLKEEEIGTMEYDNFEGHVVVHMYLAIDGGMTTKEIADHDKEEYVWVPLDKVEETLTYDNLKEFWLKAKTEIERV